MVSCPEPYNAMELPVYFLARWAAGASLFVGNNPELEAAPASPEAASATRTTALAQCPYCGVGCGTIIQAENGKIVSMRPDKDHPTNKGLQCIKGFTDEDASDSITFLRSLNP